MLRCVRCIVASLTLGLAHDDAQCNAPARVAKDNVLLQVVSAVKTEVSHVDPPSAMFEMVSTAMESEAGGKKRNTKPGTVIGLLDQQRPKRSGGQRKRSSGGQRNSKGKGANKKTNKKSVKTTTTTIDKNAKTTTGDKNAPTTTTGDGEGDGEGEGGKSGDGAGGEGDGGGGEGDGSGGEGAADGAAKGMKDAKGQLKGGNGAKVQDENNQNPDDIKSRLNKKNRGFDAGTRWGVKELLRRNGLFRGAYLLAGASSDV